MDEILITGNMVSLRSVSETRKISTEEFYESLSASVGMMTPILPPVVIFYAAQESRNIYVTHHPPQTRKLSVKHGSDETEYEIKLPHMYFFHKYQYSAFDDLFVYAAKAQVNSMAEMLYRLPLKNLYLDGWVCLGDDLKFSLEGRMAGKIARVENFFWNSVFNSDLDSTYRGAAPDSWSGDPLSFWQSISEGDDFDPCEVSWRQWRSWKEIIDQLLERET